MSFNAYTMAHITKQYRNNMLTCWQKLQKILSGWHIKDMIIIY